MSKIKKNSNQKDVETLVMEYANLSNLFGNAVETGNHKDANKIYKELMNVYKQIKLQGGWSSSSFHRLLSSPSVGTRLWSATHYLAVSYEEAKKVLNSLGDIPNSLLAVSAKITLDEWEKSRLIL